MRYMSQEILPAIGVDAKAPWVIVHEAYEREGCMASLDNRQSNLFVNFTRAQCHYKNEKGRLWRDAMTRDSVASSFWVAIKPPLPYHS